MLTSLIFYVQAYLRKRKENPMLTIGKFKIGIGIGCCSYSIQDRQGRWVPAEADIKTGLYLFPEWRIRGFATALHHKIIDEIYLLGADGEIEAYRKALHLFGITDNLIRSLPTENTTIGNGQVIKQFIRKNEIDDWLLLTSDYHCERMRLTCEIVHKLHVQNIFGTEKLILSLAKSKAARTALRKKWESSIDLAEFGRRVLHEAEGCSQLLANARDYKPVK